MSFATVTTRARLGITAPAVQVEVHLSNGLPATVIVGMPETAVRESKDRVRSALLHSGFDYPHRRITVNLAPAELRKEGGCYDLAIALGILGATGQLPVAALAGFEFLGELALTGDIRPVIGSIPAAIACHKAGHTLVLPAHNATEAAAIPGACVIPATHLLQVCAHLRGNDLVEPARPRANSSTRCADDLADVIGQPRAKRALEIAAAGRHNLLMCGPPGTGKTMLATRLPGILPPMDTEEWLEVESIRSVAAFDQAGLQQRQRPFRAPHHSASAMAIVGGGSTPRPGEITLAHHGVLFLDEMPEWSRHVLEQLREPMESGHIVVARTAHRVRFPAHFQLIAAMNPCPCGYLGSGFRACRCSPDQLRRYHDRLSGPLLDRFDLRVDVSQQSSELFRRGRATGETTSSEIQGRVIAAHALQVQRQGKSNNRLTGTELERTIRLEPADENLLAAAVTRWGLSARARHRVLRVARTIADLEACAAIETRHLAEALGFRLGELGGDQPTSEMSLRTYSQNS